MSDADHASAAAGKQSALAASWDCLAAVRSSQLRQPTGRNRPRFESSELNLERAVSLNLRHSPQSAGDFRARTILECARPASLGLHFN